MSTVVDCDITALTTFKTGSDGWGVWMTRRGEASGSYWFPDRAAAEKLVRGSCTCGQHALKQ